MARRRIGVVPAGEHAARRALFDALELTLPVRFEGREVGDWDGLDAAVLMGADPGTEQAAARTALPLLVAPCAEPPAAEAEQQPVELGSDHLLDRRLRRLKLPDEHLPSEAGVPALSGDTVLARGRAHPLWVSRPSRGAWVERVAVAPGELGTEESLRHRLRAGRFLALLALVHFLRRVTAEDDLAPPRLRACFVIDDPNLHWPSYGYVRFGKLAAHAERHGYHVAMATVPMDHWFVHPGVAGLFRDRGHRLSLLFHGNNHALRELARPIGPDARRALLAQALRRISAFERRTRIPVARVMAAPHGVCSEGMARDIALLGFQALCISRPYPWLARPPRSWLTRPAGTPPLAGWETSNLVADGLPVILRRPFTEDGEELALRAYLNQPLVLYGHHDDLAGGLELLADRAATIHGLGQVDWVSPAELARSNVATRIDGETLTLRLFSRAVRVPVPEDVRAVRFEVPPSHGDPAAEGIVCSTSDARNLRAEGLPAEMALPPGTRSLQARLVGAGAPAAGALPSPPWQPAQILRRLAGEGKARAVPLYGRSRVGRRAAA